MLTFRKTLSPLPSRSCRSPFAAPITLPPVLTALTSFVFRRVGDEYFLYQIWIEGRTTGRELPAPKRETLLARNGEKSDEIIIAANIVK